MKSLQLICECGDVLDCEEIDYRKKPNQPNLPAEPIKVSMSNETKAHKWIKFAGMNMWTCRKCNWYKRLDGAIVKYSKPPHGWNPLGYEPPCEPVRK